MAKQIVDFSKLPKSILNKIPYSLRTSGNKHNLIDLPSDIQYLLKKYFDYYKPELTYNDVIDIIPEISIYSDFKTHTDIKQVILEYLKNYLLISIGSYPFDAEFGSGLKKQLQTRDTALRSVLIGNEIGLIAGVLGEDYDIGITVDDISIDKTESSTHTEYNIEMTVNIDGESFVITV